MLNHENLKVADATIITSLVFLFSILYFKNLQHNELDFVLGKGHNFTAF